MASPLIPHARIPFGHMLAFGWMPSPLKVWAYRTFLRYRIGPHVSIGPGAAVVGDDVEIAEGVTIGLLAATPRSAR
jgi:hypothetical protein